MMTINNNYWKLYYFEPINIISAIIAIKLPHLNITPYRGTRRNGVFVFTNDINENDCSRVR